LSFARSVAFSINNLIPHQTVTDFKQWILTTFLLSHFKLHWAHPLFKMATITENRTFFECKNVVRIHCLKSVTVWCGIRLFMENATLLGPKDELHICFVSV
jgi:hypothetical protein